VWRGWEVLGCKKGRKGGRKEGRKEGKGRGGVGDGSWCEFNGVGWFIGWMDGVGWRVSGCKIKGFESGFIYNDYARGEGLCQQP
jgi:hypothetical protein